MAESDSILQLGIEAAREGNKEEARNLFRLLTRQEPDNAQAWLWLAGVAENREERQGALEHVIALDPDNEMAMKGLQALGVNPTRKLDPDEELSLRRTPEAPPPAEVREDPWDRYNVDEEDPFAALDSLSEAMNEQPEAVRRQGQPADERDVRPVVPPAPPPVEPRGRRRSGRRGTAPAVYDIPPDEDEETTMPARRGVNPILIGLILIAILILLAIIFWPEGDQVAVVPPPLANPTATLTEGNVAAGVGYPAPAVTGVPGATPAEGQGEVVPPVDASPAPVTEGDPAAPVTEGDPAAPVTEGEPAAPVTAAPADLANANPEVVAPGNVLESNGWQYVFAQPGYANSIIGSLGPFATDGRFAVVLVQVNNNTGQPQMIPQDFFVLKDAQGRVYNARPDLSTAYVNQFGRGVVADLSQEDQIPADTLRRSVPIVFDVEPDATDLKFFSRNNTNQGWLVLQNV